MLFIDDALVLTFWPAWQTSRTDCDLDRHDTVSDHPKSFRRGVGDVQNSASIHRLERNSVVDPEIHLAIVHRIAHAHAGSERQIVVGGSQSVLVETLSAGRKFPGYIRVSQLMKML